MDLVNLQMLRFHVDFAHPRLVAQRKVWIVAEKVVMEKSHNQ